jgi:hypothetical protein
MAQRLLPDEQNGRSFPASKVIDPPIDTRDEVVTDELGKTPAIVVKFNHVQVVSTAPVKFSN